MSGFRGVTGQVRPLLRLEVGISFPEVFQSPLGQFTVGVGLLKPMEPTEVVVRGESVAAIVVHGWPAVG